MQTRGTSPPFLVGVILGLLSYVRNLRRTQRKDEKMIEELTSANEHVLKADAAKDRFIQNMTHELRTPLNAITGFSQLLALPDGMFSPEEKEEFGKHVMNNTSMMTMLLDDLMSTSAMDSGGYKITMGEAECESICNEAMRAAEHRLQSGVPLLFKPSMELPFTFNSDALRIQQVLTNLLTNACKHTSAGEIRLGCSLEEVPGMIAFSIEDTRPRHSGGGGPAYLRAFCKTGRFRPGYRPWPQHLPGDCRQDERQNLSRYLLQPRRTLCLCRAGVVPLILNMPVKHNGLILSDLCILLLDVLLGVKCITY